MLKSNWSFRFIMTLYKKALYFNENDMFFRFFNTVRVNVWNTILN